MNSQIPKQFLLLNGKPVLMHTIEAFHFSDIKPKIILVLNAEFHLLWKELCDLHNFTIPCTIVNNGTERFHSVKNGLGLADDHSVIAVHDAVRPVVSNELITRSFYLADHCGAVIPVVTSKDSVRLKEGNDSITLNREDVVLVQTPQVFKAELLKNAYNQKYSKEFTDDASVVEKAGHHITLTQGDYKNIKITYSEDLELAALYLEKAKKNPANGPD